MRIVVRKQKQALLYATGLLLSAATALLYYTFQVPTTNPIESNGSNSNNQVGIRVRATTENTTIGTFTASHDSWQKPLRRPLYDPPPPPPPKKRPPPPLGVELMGTIVEPGNSMAIVTVARGQTEYKRLGDKLGPEESPAELVEILEDAIVVEREGEKTTLRRER